MTMTKQHFVALAQALKNEDPRRSPDYHKAQLSTWEGCVAAVADVCAASNAQFKRAAFYAACGLTEVA